MGGHKPAFTRRQRPNFCQLAHGGVSGDHGPARVPRRVHQLKREVRQFNDRVEQVVVHAKRLHSSPDRRVGNLPRKRQGVVSRKNRDRRRPVMQLAPVRFNVQQGSLKPTRKTRTKTSGWSRHSSITQDQHISQDQHITHSITDTHSEGGGEGELCKKARENWQKEKGERTDLHTYH